MIGLFALTTCAKGKRWFDYKIKKTMCSSCTSAKNWGFELTSILSRSVFELEKNKATILEFAFCCVSNCKRHPKLFAKSSTKVLCCNVWGLLLNPRGINIEPSLES